MPSVAFQVCLRESSFFIPAHSAAAATPQDAFVSIDDEGDGIEEGTRLAKVCQTRLAQAETKIQQLEKNAAGELTLRPVETNE